FIHIALDIVAFMSGEFKVVYPLDNGAQRRAIVDFERRAAKEELPRVTQVRELMHAFDGAADGVKQFVARERDEISPGEARTFARKESSIFLVKRSERFVFF